MKVHLIKKQSIEDFATANARSRSSFEEWLEKLKQADWEKQVHLFVCWIGVHTVYDDLNANNQQYIVNSY